MNTVNTMNTIMIILRVNTLEC